MASHGIVPMGVYRLVLTDIDHGIEHEESKGWDYLQLTGGPGEYGTRVRFHPHDGNRFVIESFGPYHEDYRYWNGDERYLWLDKWDPAKSWTIEETEHGFLLRDRSMRTLTYHDSNKGLTLTKSCPDDRNLCYFKALRTH